MLREYKENDIQRIVELEEKHLESTLGEDYYRESLTNPLARHYVYEDRNTIVGFVSTIFDGASLEILNIVVDKKDQSKGIGTKMLASVFDSLVPLGLHDVTLEVRESNAPAIHLYEKFGFKTIRVRKEYYKNKENALFMQKCYDDAKDMIQLEANLFSKKEGNHFISDFKERYCLNYFDYFDNKVSSFQNLKYDSYLMLQTNWYDEAVFQDFEVDKIALMHVNAFHYQSLTQKHHNVLINHLDGFIDYLTCYNLQYGRDYSKKQAEFSYKNIIQGKQVFLSVVQDERILGHILLFESDLSIFVNDLFVVEEFRHQSIASSLMDSVVQYAKEKQKLEIYLDADLEDTPLQMYQKMNFSIVETYYELLQVK